MKLIRSQKSDGTGRAFVFRISQEEKDTLLAILKLYPMLDASYHQLSRKPKTTGRADQEWLEEAMDQQRQDHKEKTRPVFK